MSVYVTLVMQDINSEKSTVGAWVADAAAALTYAQAIKAASNAYIVEGFISTPVAIGGLASNVASATNVETVRSKAMVKMRGINGDSTAEPFSHVTVQIPAPLGTLINGLTGDPTQADLVALMGKVKSNTGVQMTVVERIQYSR